MIPYSHQTIDQDDIDAVITTLKSDWLTQGPKIKEFENVLASYSGTKYAVVVSSGTAALQAAYFAARIGRGDEIITSPMTFAATANAAIWQGTIPVFVDIERDTGNINASLIERKITKKTKAIVPVDYSGLPCDYDVLRKIAKKNKLILISDAAHSLGAEYRGQKVGGLADMTIFSFHPVKSITTGEGGAVLTDSEEYYKRLLLFRTHGITKDSNSFVNKPDGVWYHEMQELGLNYRMTDIQAALGVSQMRKIAAFMRARRRIADFYSKELSGVDGLILPKTFDDRKSSFHLYPIRLSGKLQRHKKSFVESLHEAGIGVQVHYIPVYWHPFYEKAGYKRGICKVAESFYKSEISIPICPNMTRFKQCHVTKVIKSIYKYIK